MTLNSIDSRQEINIPIFLFLLTVVDLIMKWIEIIQLIMTELNNSFIINSIIYYQLASLYLMETYLLSDFLQLLRILEFPFERLLLIFDLEKE